MKEAHSGGKNVYEEALKLVPGEIEGALSILDVGTGNGHFVKMMEEEGYENITCCDIENNMQYDYDVIEMDLNKDFKFEPNSFDVVTALEVIEHLENPRHFLRECKRVLKKDGCIVLSTPNIQHFKGRLKFLIKGVLYGFDKKDYRISGHITPITSQDLYRICEELNLEIDKFDYNDLHKSNIIARIKTTS